MRTLLSTLLTLIAAAPAFAQDKEKDKDKKVAAKIKEVAGSAEFLRSVPKHFATLQAVDPVKRQVTILAEGDKEPKTWPLVPDAEIKVLGWWGRLDDLPKDGRVWVWLKLDRKKQPVAVSMIADEISQQQINGPGVKFQKLEDGRVTFLDVKGKTRTLDCAVKVDLKKGATIYVQSEGDRVRTLLDQDGFEHRHKNQKEKLRERWVKEGLPGTVAFVHVFSGEMDLILDHETMRWARSLKKGDGVTLLADPAIKAVVKTVEPWRERTLLRLVVRSIDLADLKSGERLNLLRTPPAPEVDSAALPPDIDRPRKDKQERLDWFLASIYCACKVAGDGCTGHFYTLSSCNPNACAMPLYMRKVIADEIDAGKSDRQIFEHLLEKYGPTLTRPHLVP
ncbi:MAG: hypothetical protein U0793_17910 [Gemmataceae bacterium]